LHRLLLLAAILVPVALGGIAWGWHRLSGRAPVEAAGSAEGPDGSRAGGGDADRPQGAPASGKWRLARSPVAAEAPSDEATAELQAVPYLQGYRPARGGPVIVRHDRRQAWNGVNLYVSGHAPEALLIDMEGRVLHRWSYDLRRLWPDLYQGAQAETTRRLEYWRRAELQPDGGLLAIFEGLGLVELDASSRLVWAYRGGAHHDLFTHPDGTVWVLDRRSRVVTGVPGQRRVLEDLVTVLSSAGEVRRQISIVEALARSPYAPLLADLPPEPDVLHTNTLELIGETPLAAALPAFQPGHLLLSLHTRDAVVVLDPEREEVVWSLAGMWRRQHQPVLLASGRLLVFDNVGPRYASRAIEVDPLTQRVVWSWPSPPSPELLFSKTLGSVQRLPNGNTLLTESENGRALEVTAAGEVVWEMSSPHRAGEHGELVATLFEVVRLPADHPGVRLARGLP
jgi:hypothetical protein